MACSAADGPTNSIDNNEIIVMMQWKMAIELKRKSNNSIATMTSMMTNAKRRESKQYTIL